MSYNATVDITSIDIANNFKYDQNPLYEKSLRNIKYLPYDSSGIITDDLIDFFNTMIVRRDTEYYEKSRSKSNFPMENSDILNSVRNELNDYLQLYNKFTNSLNNIDKSNWSQSNKYEEYKYMINKYTIPEIIRLNKLIYLYISVPNNVPSPTKYNMNRYLLFIGLIIFLTIIILICINHNKF